nr:type I-E CRISPR-associated protein Cse1/CasA [Lactiplantibacillus carotarum]
MQVQDLAILRLLLAILTTIYSRVDGNGEAYEWLDVDPKSFQGHFDLDDDVSPTEIQEDLQDTWKQLSQTGQFSGVVTQYLHQYASRFDLFGEHPFYQATTEEYDALVPAKKQVATGTGQVNIKQINRRISESANSPAIFAPKVGTAKNQVSTAEFVRWLITYQNFTGVTDKTKVVTPEKFSNPAGWLYRINPVYADGDSLFETLMLNLILTIDADQGYTIQKPVWEFESVQQYVTERKKQLVPDNIAELYTTWSRILHVQWQDQQPKAIFSAGIPIFEADGAFIEPMTTWRRDKKTKVYRPAVKGLRSLGKSMWRDFGRYVQVTQTDDIHEPGIVAWLHDLKDNDMIPDEQLLALKSVAFISDGNATSQSPAVEITDDMHIQADVLFDQANQDFWPAQIEAMIELTQDVGKDYYGFASSLAQIRNLDVRTFAGPMSAKFYERLNEPFKAWLSSLTGQDERNDKVNLWKQQLKRIVFAMLNGVIQTSSPRDISGIEGAKGPINIFTASNQLRRKVQVHLDIKGKAE